MLHCHTDPNFQTNKSVDFSSNRGRNQGNRCFVYDCLKKDDEREINYTLRGFTLGNNTLGQRFWIFNLIVQFCMNVLIPIFLAFWVISVPPLFY